MPHAFQTQRDDPLNVYLAAVLAREAYDDLATFGDRLPKYNTTLKPVGAFEQRPGFHLNGLLDTQGVVAADDDTVVIAFRGTEMQKWADALTDLSALLVPGYGGRVHQGFKQAFEGITDEMEPLLKDHAHKKFYLTGHSLGGALATLAAVKLHPKHKVEAVYTFGQPAVGDQAFADAYPHPERHFRFINNLNKVYDPVPLVPLQEKIASLSWFSCLSDKAKQLPEILQSTYAHVKRPRYITEIGKDYGDEGPGLIEVLKHSNMALLSLIVSFKLTREELKAWLKGLGGNHAMAEYLACAKQAAKIPD